MCQKTAAKTRQEQKTGTESLTSSMVTSRLHFMNPAPADGVQLTHPAPLATMAPVTLDAQQVTTAPELPVQQQKSSSFDEKKTKVKSKVKEKIDDHRAKKAEKQRQKAEEQRAQQAYQDSIDHTCELIDQYFEKNPDTGVPEIGELDRSQGTQSIVYKGHHLSWEGIPDATYRANIERQMDYYHDALYETKEGKQVMTAGGQAMRYYGSTHYTEVNSLLRTGGYDGVDAPFRQMTYEKSRAAVEFLNSQQAQEDMITVRHVGLDALPHLLGKSVGKCSSIEQAMKSKKKIDYQGVVGEDRAFTSTTTLAQGSENFRSYPVEMRMLIPKGTHGCFIKEAASSSQEDEFLLQAGTKFRILKMEEKDTGHGLAGTTRKIVLYMVAQPNFYDMSKFPAAPPAAE
ncbi:MAG: hypothetical protein IK115_03525 [Lachnospiraceae bacterium]|nr:hypothetical protein [Lachnospiraceae bacterium]